MNKNKIGLAFGIFGLLSLWSVYLIVFSGEGFFVSHEQNQVHRDVLLKMRADLALGIGYEEVLRTYWGKRTERLRLYADHESKWTIATPAEMLASEWMLSLEFGNGILTAIKVRSGDGPKPLDAPDDIL